jgi:hypothetical protein
VDGDHIVDDLQLNRSGKPRSPFDVKEEAGGALRVHTTTTRRTVTTEKKEHEVGSTRIDGLMYLHQQGKTYRTHTPGLHQAAEFSGSPV